VEAILEAAAQVFERDGFAAGTTNRIAERAGVSIGSLYQYFPNKDAILVALARHHMAEGATMLLPIVSRLNEGEPWEEVLPGIVEAMVALHAVAPMLHRALFEESRLPGELREEMVALEDAMVDVSEQALIADPTIEVRDTRVVASVMVNAIEGLTHRLVLRPPPGVSIEAISTEITRMVRAYLLAAQQAGA